MGNLMAVVPSESLLKLLVNKKWGLSPLFSADGVSDRFGLGSERFVNQLGNEVKSL